MAEFEPYISEIRFLGGPSVDFIEVALDSGTDPASIQVVVYHADGTVRSITSLDATPDNTIAGTDVYSVETGIHKMGAVALVVDGTVVSFLSFHNDVTATEGPADGMTADELGHNSAGESFVSTDMGATYSVSDTPDPGTIPCFLAGTLIDTPLGARPIEALGPGDKVNTYDGGVQVLKWVGSRCPDTDEVLDNNLYPICIPAGALGTGTPSRDVYVSPAHRVLVTAATFEMLFEDNEVLIAAHHLVGRNGIHVARTITSPNYFHLLFEDHQLLLTSAMVSESFYPMQQGVSSLERDVRDELYMLFPVLKYRASLYGPTSRRCLRAFEAQVAVESLARAA
ncbi:MAG: Hint domain-containing protein [Rhodobacteraceae bacterium]|nr:Hint domain-containing protein [Paracoccaceae bacterium]